MPEPTPTPLSGRTVLVTGGSRGIGAAIARRAADLGAKVAITSRKLEDLESVAREIQDRGGTCLPVKCHVGHLDEVEDLFARVKGEFGSIHGLVNNAGTNPHFGPMLDATTHEIDKTLEVNVKGYLLTIRHFLKSRCERTGGSVVNIASVAGSSATTQVGVYGMSKAAVISMTQTLALECAGTGVRFNSISPGLIETKFTRDLLGDDDRRGQLLAATPASRIGTPEDIAEMAVFLLSDATSYITGQNIVIDGGLTLRRLEL